MYAKACVMHNGHESDPVGVSVIPGAQVGRVKNPACRRDPHASRLNPNPKREPIEVWNGKTMH